MNIDAVQGYLHDVHNIRTPIQGQRQGAVLSCEDDGSTHVTGRCYYLLDERPKDLHKEMRPTQEDTLQRGFVGTLCGILLAGVALAALGVSGGDEATSTCTVFSCEPNLARIGLFFLVFGTVGAVLGVLRGLVGGLLGLALGAIVLALVMGIPEEQEAFSNCTVFSCEPNYARISLFLAAFTLVGAIVGATYNKRADPSAVEVS